MRGFGCSGGREYRINVKDRDGICIKESLYQFLAKSDNLNYVYLTASQVPSLTLPPFSKKITPLLLIL